MSASPSTAWNSYAADGLHQLCTAEPVRSGNAAFIGIIDDLAGTGSRGGVDAKAEDKSQYTLFNPTPVDKMRDFNTDRPTKSNVPYTVDAGHFQYEGDLFVYGYDNMSTPDTNITSWTVGNPTFKVGLLNNVDFEVNFSFYNSIRVGDGQHRHLFDLARLRRHLHALQVEPVRQRAAADRPWR